MRGYRHPKGIRGRRRSYQRVFEAEDHKRRIHGDIARPAYGRHHVPHGARAFGGGLALASHNPQMSEDIPGSSTDPRYQLMIRMASDISAPVDLPRRMTPILHLLKSFLANQLPRDFGGRDSVLFLHFINILIRGKILKLVTLCHYIYNCEVRSLLRQRSMYNTKCQLTDDFLWGYYSF